LHEYCIKKNMKIAYVNGRYVPLQHAVVPMQDRGYQFADGIYEVAMFYNQRFLDIDLHLARLHRSLAEMRIKWSMTDAALRMILRRLLQLNKVVDGYVYLQITRGVAPRNHLFPAHVKPMLTACVMPTRPAKATAYTQGVRVITAQDIRHARCDIKSIALLPNMLLKQQAHEAGAAEVFLFNAHDELTECAVSTAYIVKGGVVQTHPENHAVLNGVRKQVVRRLCEQNNIPYVERMIARVEVMAADEAFLTSANSHILPVTKIDDAAVADGKVGAVSKRLLSLYQAHVTAQTGKIWN
jgi:D-alanine transaminase